jgi:hypothetical protein
MGNGRRRRGVKEDLGRILNGRDGMKKFVLFIG